MLFILFQLFQSFIIPGRSASRVQRVHPSPSRRIHTPRALVPSQTVFILSKWTLKEEPCIFVNGQPTKYHPLAEADVSRPQGVPGTNTIYSHYSMYVPPIERK